MAIKLMRVKLFDSNGKEVKELVAVETNTDARAASGKLPNLHAGDKIMLDGKRYQVGVNITEIKPKDEAGNKEPLSADAPEAE